MEFMTLRSLRNLSGHIGVSVESLLDADSVWVSEQLTVAEAYEGWLRHLEDQE